MRSKIKPTTLEAAIATRFHGWRFTSTGPLMDFKAAHHVRAALQAVADYRIVTPAMRALAKIPMIVVDGPTGLHRCPVCRSQMIADDPANHLDSCEWIRARLAIQILEAL